MKIFVTVHSVHSNVAKIHSRLPAAMEFWLVCLGILAYSWPVLADLVLKGYVKDKEGAYEAMKQSALREDRGLGLLKKYICPTLIMPRAENFIHHTID